MKILGIETSCDETAVSLIQDKKILSEKIASQADIHSAYGGVVPEIASREHLKKLNILLENCLIEAGAGFDDIDAVSVTSRPGLEGSLLVGITAARSISAILDIPLIEVDHIEAHLFAREFSDPGPAPGIGLVISGGHTRLMYIKEWGDYKILGDTRDDAVGEAFDKVASLLSLPYPGGPSIEKASEGGDKTRFIFPVSKMKNMYDFSYSGLKTAVLYELKYRLKREATPEDIKDIAASFQEAAFEPILKNSIAAAKEYSAEWIFISGGVAANSRLRDKFKEALAGESIRAVFPPPRLCTDNASMVAACAAFYIGRESYENKN